MVPAVQNLTGMTLDDIIAKSNKNATNAGIYGPKTISLLSSMGYTMIGSNMQLSSVFVNPNAQGSPIFNGAGKLHCGFAATAILVLLCL